MTLPGLRWVATPPSRVPPHRPPALRPLRSGPWRSAEPEPPPIEEADVAEVAEDPVAIEAADIFEATPVERAEPEPSEAAQQSESGRVRRWRDRRVNLRRQPVLVVAAFLVILVLAATWFSTSQGVEDIAGEGQIGVRAEAGLSAAAAVRNRTAQAVVLGRADTVGAADPGDVEQAVQSVERAILEFEKRIDTLRPLLDEETAAELTADAAVLVNGAETAVGSVLAGDAAAAAATIDSIVDPGFTQLANGLVDVRAASFQAISVARDSAGRVALAARFVVAFLIPLGAVLGYRFVARRRQRQRELQLQLQKERELVQARDDLIASVSHELRTPLTGILGFALAAVSDEELDAPSLRDMTAIIATEADDLSRMVDDLITAARDGGGGLAMAPELVDPQAELDAVLVATEIGGTKVRAEMEEGRIEVDRLRLHQIYRNLLSNAVKHGGPDVGVVGVVDSDRYVISVTDDGEGIAEEELGQLFERFVHGTDAAFTTGSVGLGLAIAHRLATLMDGSLEYMREGGRTVFRLSFPLARGD